MTIRRENILNKAFVFLLGAAVGAVASGLYFKSKYEKIANEEIESVKEVYSRRKENTSDQISTVDLMTELSTRLKKEAAEKPDAKTYTDIINKAGYSNEVQKGGSEVSKKPFIIPPEEFDDNPDYDKETLTLYADGVLTDIYDDVIDEDDIDDLVGKESLGHFGEYEDDCVYVRNEDQKTDYEILRDNRKYSEVCSPDSGD